LDLKMSSSKSGLGGTDFRRKWDSEEYEDRARKRIRMAEEAEEEAMKGKGKPVVRELLKQRTYKVDLDSRLNKTQVITRTTPLSQSGGYYCGDCDCIVKDSINYLDHINGKKHQRNLGMSMKVERSTVDDVKKMFEQIKRRKEEESREYDVTKRLEELQEEEEKTKAYRRDKRKEKKKKAVAEEEGAGGMDPEMAKLMGFGGFGGSRRN